MLSEAAIRLPTGCWRQRAYSGFPGTIQLIMGCRCGTVFSLLQLNDHGPVDPMALRKIFHHAARPHIMNPPTAGPS